MPDLFKDWNDIISTKNDPISLPLLEEMGVRLWMKREDLIHSTISGNKWRKLKYHLLSVISSEGFKGIVTMGGAFSNHILAVAEACKLNGLQSSAFIRGERVEPLNPTLSDADQAGMNLIFVDRASYGKGLDMLIEEHGISEDWYSIPEGGTSDLGIKGCTEILNEDDKSDFDYIIVSFGTGGTATGLGRSLGKDQRLLVFPSLKGYDVTRTIGNLGGVDLSQLQVVSDYHFGGYAKVHPELISFMNDFEKETSIPLDPIYTAKMLFGLLEEIKKGRFEDGARILAIHTGGLQGRRGMEQRLGFKFSGED